jgi:hypothetical protein
MTAETGVLGVDGNCLNTKRLLVFSGSQGRTGKVQPEGVIRGKNIKV